MPTNWPFFARRPSKSLLHRHCITAVHRRGSENPGRLSEHRNRRQARGDRRSERGVRRLQNRLKLGGVKFVTDGSPQGKTAFWTQPLLTGGPEGEKDYVGAPTFPRDVIVDLYRKVTTNGIQIWSHANGDAAIDIVIDAATSAGVGAGDDRRHIVIHSQCMRPDQLDSYVRIGLSPSFFTAHTFFWGMFISQTSALIARRSSAQCGARRRKTFASRTTMPSW